MWLGTELQVRGAHLVCPTNSMSIFIIYISSPLLPLVSNPTGRLCCTKTLVIGWGPKFALSVLPYHKLPQLFNGIRISWETVHAYHTKVTPVRISFFETPMKMSNPDFLKILKRFLGFGGLFWGNGVWLFGSWGMTFWDFAFEFGTCLMKTSKSQELLRNWKKCSSFK